MDDKTLYSILAQIFPVVLRSPEVSGNLQNTQAVTAAWAEIQERQKALDQPPQEASNG